jgi:hypothetical protein
MIFSGEPPAPSGAPGEKAVEKPDSPVARRPGPD